MTRLLRVISGSDQSPTADFTDDTNWPETELAMSASDGASGVGRVVIYDEDGVIPDSLGQKFLNSHNVIIVEDGPYRLFRGRVNTRAYSRGERAGKRVRMIEVTTGDTNTDLRGLVVDNWVRAEETDVARVQALVAAYLSGSPRATTNLNGSNYISGSNTTTLDAKTYSAMTPQDVINEIALTAGKTFFVTVDDEVFYDGTESTAYASSLRISDDPADANATTFAPQWRGGTASTEDGIEQLTALRSYYGSGGERSIRVTNTLATSTDYWEGLFWDDGAQTSAQASQRAQKKLEEQSDDLLTISFGIGPIPWSQLGSIKAGQTIQVKARAARGGRTSSGTYSGDSFITMRIADLRWQMPAPDLYMCLLELGIPRRIGLGRGSKPPPLGSDVGTSCVETFCNRTVASGGWGTSEFGPVWQLMSDVYPPPGNDIRVVDGYGYIEATTAQQRSYTLFVDLPFGIGDPFEVLVEAQMRWCWNSCSFGTPWLNSTGLLFGCDFTGQPDPWSADDSAATTLIPVLLSGSPASPPMLWALRGLANPAPDFTTAQIASTSTAAEYAEVEFNWRVRRDGEFFQVKFWLRDTPEPAAWSAQQNIAGISSLVLTSLAIDGSTDTTGVGSGSRVRVSRVTITSGCDLGVSSLQYGDC